MDRHNDSKIKVLAEHGALSPAPRPGGLRCVWPADEGRMFDRRIFSDNVFAGRPHGGGFYPFLLSSWIWGFGRKTKPEDPEH